MLVIGGVFVDVKGFARSTYMPLERNVGDVQVTAGGVCRNVAENLIVPDGETSPVFSAFFVDS